MTEITTTSRICTLCGWVTKDMTRKQCGECRKRQMVDDIVVEVVKGQLCGCGCGEMTKGGKFRPGHDARAHRTAAKAAGGQLAEKIAQCTPSAGGSCIMAEDEHCSCRCGGANHGIGKTILWRMLESVAVSGA